MRRLRDARPAGWVTCFSICPSTESPKQDSKGFNSIVNTIGFDHLVIIYLWSGSLSILQTERGEVGWANVWKTQESAVRSLTNIYSLVGAVAD